MVDMTSATTTNPEHLLPPGFRFHPTDEELILHYLRNRARAVPCPVNIIAEVDIYKFDPWELPTKAVFGDREWYFFSPRDRKYPNGVRPNRAAGSGYWKATGTDKAILSTAAGSGAAAPRRESVGVKKALVFYRGKPPRGSKTNWIMHEYRLPESGGGNVPAAARRMMEQQQYMSGGGYSKQAVQMPSKDSPPSMRLDDWVLCRIYEKANHNTNPNPSHDQQPQHSAGSTLDPDRFPAEGDLDLDVEDSSNIHAPPSFGYPDTSIQNHGSFYRSLPKAASLSDLLAETDISVLSRLLNETPVPPPTDNKLPDLLTADLGTRPLQPMGYQQQLAGHSLEASTAAHATLLSNKRHLLIGPATGSAIQRQLQSKKQRLGSGESAYSSVMNGCSSFTSSSSTCNLAAGGAEFVNSSPGAYTQLLSAPAPHPPQFTFTTATAAQDTGAAHQPYMMSRLHQQHMQMQQLLNAGSNGSLKFH